MDRERGLAREIAAPPKEVTAVERARGKFWSESALPARVSSSIRLSKKDHVSVKSVEESVSINSSVAT